MVEDVIASLESKNPNVKEETCKFLTRAISQLTQATLPKPILKQITPVLIKVSNNPVFRASFSSSPTRHGNLL